MKNLKYILLSLVGLCFIAACSDDKDNPVYDASTAVAPSFSNTLSSAYVLTLDKADETFADFAYSAANWGLPLASSYTLQASLTNDFASPVNLGSDTKSAMKISVTNAQINSILINNGIKPGVATPIYFRVLANVVATSGTVGGITALASPVVSATVTPYNTEVVYPHVWVLGDFNGWSHDAGAAQYLYSYNSDTKYTGIIDFAGKASNGWKITGAANWDNSTGNWGIGSTAPAAEASTITMSNGGGNISCYSKNFYFFSFVESSLAAPVLTVEYSFDKLSIVGEAGSQVSGWGTKEVDLKFDPAKSRFYADVTLTAGPIKFRLDHYWGPVDFGKGSTDGSLKLKGDNIAVTAGNYRVYVFLNNPDKMTYELNTKDYGK
jgi:hypothetical protein